MMMMKHLHCYSNLQCHCGDYDPMISQCGAGGSGLGWWWWWCCTSPGALEEMAANRSFSAEQQKNRI